jgi:phosphoglycolate phosphatase
MVPHLNTHCVIFDLDGTLTNPEVGIIECLQHALGIAGGVHGDDSALRHYIGRPLEETFRSLKVPETSIELAISVYRRRFAERGIYENQLIEGISVVLDQLLARRWMLGVATCKSTEHAMLVLDHFDIGHRFRFVSGATTDGNRRHKTDVLEHALQELKVEREFVTMVGDRQDDLIAAEACGIHSIAVTWGFGDRSELANPSLIGVVDTPQQLLTNLLSTATRPAGPNRPETADVEHPD